MGLGRVEAFSDGVIAVIVTIMVLEIKPPENGELAALLKLKLALLNYLLSFAVVAIFWVNHRVTLGLVRHVDARVLWANNNLLFWMSLIPFATAYMGQTNAAPLSVAVYAALLGVTALSFTLLAVVVSTQHKDNDEMMRRRKRGHAKNTFTTALYFLAIPLAFASIQASFFIFILVPLLYFVPEKLTESKES